MIKRGTFGFLFATAILTAMVPATAGQAQQSDTQQTGQSRVNLGTFAPHFRALAADKVYMRTGPGKQYPVRWVYQRKGLPLYAIDQFEAWLQVRDRDGIEGWIHQRLLTRSRRAVVIGDTRDIYADENGRTPVFRAEPGVVVALLACRERMCFVQKQKYEGWIDRAYLFGVQDGDLFE